MAKTIISEFEVPFPERESLKLHITIGACKFVANPDGGKNWLEGDYTHKESAASPKLVLKGGTLKLSQDVGTVGQITRFFNWTPRFDVRLGKGQPYTLDFDSGAMDAKLDLGGLPITELTGDHGAGRVIYNFSQPTTTTMKKLVINGGAMKLEMHNLANAGFEEMKVAMGAASCALDFSGELRHEASVKIDGGMGAVEIFVPETTPAQISVDSVLGSTDIGDGFTKKEKSYLTLAAANGQTPLLTIQASVSMGTLKLRTS